MKRLKHFLLFKFKIKKNIIYKKSIKDEHIKRGLIKRVTKVN